MSEVDNALDGIYDSELIAKRKAQSQAAFEEKIVKKILEQSGLSDRVHDLRKRAADATGKSRLTFSWMYEEHPDFPIWLAIQQIPWVAQTKIPDVFNKFSNTRMLKAWGAIHDEAPVEDKPIGLVFRWAGIKGQHLIVHNVEKSLDYTTPTIICRVGKSIITIERFDQFMSWILANWNI